MVKDNLKKSNAAGELFRGLGGVSGIMMHDCCDCEKVSKGYQSYDYEREHDLIHIDIRPYKNIKKALNIGMVLTSKVLGLDCYDDSKIDFISNLFENFCIAPDNMCTYGRRNLVLSRVAERICETTAEDILKTVDGTDDSEMFNFLKVESDIEEDEENSLIFMDLKSFKYNLDYDMKCLKQRKLNKLIKEDLEKYIAYAEYTDEDIPDIYSAIDDDPSEETDKIIDEFELKVMKGVILAREIECAEYDYDRHYMLDITPIRFETNKAIYLSVMNSIIANYDKNGLYRISFELDSFDKLAVEQIVGTLGSVEEVYTESIHGAFTDYIPVTSFEHTISADNVISSILEQAEFEVSNNAINIKAYDKQLILKPINCLQLKKYNVAIELNDKQSEDVDNILKICSGLKSDRAYLLGKGLDLNLTSNIYKYLNQIDPLYNVLGQRLNDGIYKIYYDYKPLSTDLFYGITGLAGAEDSLSMAAAYDNIKIGKHGVIENSELEHVLNDLMSDNEMTRTLLGFNWLPDSRIKLIFTIETYKYSAGLLDRLFDYISCDYTKLNETSNMISVNRLEKKYNHIND